MDGIVSYEDALSAVSSAAERGIDVYDMCIAAELRSEINREKRTTLSRRKAARDKIEEDADKLFSVARGVWSGSAGAADPRSLARSTVRCYITNGMDVDNVIKCSKNYSFVVQS